MAQLINRAQPGDVITAELWNLVVDAVNELLQSGQTTGIKVAATLPVGTAVDPIRIGTLLQITGQNFGFSIGQSKVIFESQTGKITIPRESMLNGSSDDRLLLLVPAIPGITNEGITMTLRVDNGVADDSRTVFVMPVVINLTGDMFVNWRADVSPNPNPNPMQQSAAAAFAYRLQTGINLPATFDLSAEILNASVAVPAGLIGSIEFRDEGNNLIQNKRVEMGKSDTRNISVRIPAIPPTFAGQTFTLKVTASAGSVVGTDSRTFTVGTPVPPADPNIEALQTGFVVLDEASGQPDINPANGTLDGSTIKLKVGKRIVVAFNVKLKQQGTYDVTFLPKQGTTLNNWAPQLVNTLTPITVAADNDPTSRLMQIGVTPSAGATASGTVVFRIKRQTAVSDFSKEFTVQLLP